MSDADNSMNGLEKNSQKASKSVMDIAKGIGVFKMVDKAVGMVTNSVDGAIKRYDTLNNSGRAFENMGFTAQEVEAAMNDLNDSITGLPTPLDMAIRNVQLLASSTEDVGRSERIFSAMNNAILGFGGTTAQVDNAVTQLSQAFSNGRVDAQTWNSMINANLGPTLAALAKQMGYTTGGLKTALSEGTVSVEEFQDALIDLNINGGGGLKSLEQIARDATGGISTGLANMRTAVVRGVESIVRAIDEALSELNLGSIGEVIANVGSAFENALKFIATLIPPAITLIGTFFNALSSGGSVLSNIIAEFRWAFGYIQFVVSLFVDEVRSRLPAVRDAFTDFVDRVSPIIERLVTVITVVATTVVHALADLIPPAIDVAIFAFELMEGKIIPILDIVSKVLLEFALIASDVIIGTVVPALQSLMEWITSNKSTVETLAAVVVGLFAAFKTYTVLTTVSNSLKTLKTGFDNVKTGMSLLKEASSAKKAFGEVADVMDKGSLASKAFSGAQKVVNAVLAVNPWFIVAAAVIGLVAAVIYLWNTNEDFKNALIKIWNNIRDVISKGVERIKEAWNTAQEAFDNGIQRIKDAWENTTRFFSNMWSGITDGASDLWNGLKTGASDAWNSVKSAWSNTKTFFSNLWSDSVDATQEAWEDTKSFFTDLWSTIKDGAIEGWETFSSTVMPYIQPIVDLILNLWTTLSDGLSTIWDNIKIIAEESWTIIKNVILGPILLLLDLATGDFEAFKDNLSGIWGNIKESAGIIWDSIKNVVMTYIDTLIESATTIWETFKEGVINIWEAIKTRATEIWELLKESVIEIVTNVVDRVTEFWENLKVNIKQLGEDIKNGAINNWNNLRQGVIDAAETLRQGATNAWENLKISVINAAINLRDSAVSAWNNLRDNVITAATNLKDSAISAWNTLKDSVETAANNLKDGAIQAWTTLRDRTRYWFDRIKNVILAIGDIDLFQIGKDIVNGLIGGIRDTFGRAREVVTDLAEGVKGWIAGALNLHSPSRWMRDEVGKNIVLGMVEGIDNNIQKVKNSMTGVADAVKGTRFESPSVGINGSIAKSNSSVNSMIQHEFEGNNRIVSALERLASKGNVIVLDSGELVGATYPQYDRAGGSKTQMDERWGRY